MNKLIVGVALMVVSGSAWLAWLKYDEWITYPPLRAHVSNHLKDPASTQYRNEFRTKSGWLCGELNSKNAMGAYTGFRRFVAGSADDSYLEGFGRIRSESADAMQSNQRFMESLDEEIKALKRMNSGQYAGFSKEESIAAIRREQFEPKWKEICE